MVAKIRLWHILQLHLLLTHQASVQQGWYAHLPHPPDSSSTIPPLSRALCLTMQITMPHAHLWLALWMMPTRLLCAPLTWLYPLAAAVLQSPSRSPHQQQIILFERSIFFSASSCEKDDDQNEKYFRFMKACWRFSVRATCHSDGSDAMLLNQFLREREGEGEGEGMFLLLFPAFYLSLSLFSRFFHRYCLFFILLILFFSGNR